MERFLDVTDSPYGKAWKDYFAYEEKMVELSKKYLDSLGCETEQFGYLDDKFYIEPTEKDLLMYGKMLCKPEANGLRSFKLRSKVATKWIELLEQEGITNHLFQPSVGMYIRNILAYGEPHQSSLIRRNERIYLQITGTTEGKLDPNENYIEITGAEFYTLKESK